MIPFRRDAHLQTSVPLVPVSGSGGFFVRAVGFAGEAATAAGTIRRGDVREVIAVSGGWVGSDRSRRLPSDWSRRRASVKRRAGGRCEVFEGGARCVMPGEECDHIQPGDDHSLSNLQWICVPHHRAKTSREAAAARPRMHRPPEVHPALR